MPPYFSYFLNFFLTLDISRPNFRGAAQYTLDALKAASLGPAFAPFIQDLETAIAGFDTNLIERNDPTAGDTELFRQARKAWLDWVLEQQVKVVNPALFGKPTLQDFRKYTRGKLAVLDQDRLPASADALVKLYDDNQTVLQPLYAVYNPTPKNETPVTMVDRATALVQALRAADSTRDQSGQAIDTAILDLAQDWVAVARALQRAKAMLELTFNEPARVYGFFDLSKARKPNRPRKQGGKDNRPPAS